MSGSQQPPPIINRSQFVTLARLMLGFFCWAGDNLPVRFASRSESVKSKSALRSSVERVCIFLQSKQVFDGQRRVGEEKPRSNLPNLNLPLELENLRLVNAIADGTVILKSGFEDGDLG
jgi:hypothetical protein